MLPQDIRIGNLVYDSLRNKEVKIELKHFRELAISEKVFFERYKGIVITEGKLLGFGFETYKITFWKLPLVLGHYASGWHHLSDGSIINKGIKLEYAHQLQNLYYSLKNEELPIAQ